MPYTSHNYEDIYTQYGESKENLIESLRDTDIKKYRIKSIRSGDFLECEIYPIWNTNKKRMGKKNKSREAQKNLNNKNAVKNIIRLTNVNFTKKDIWVTYGYGKKHLPRSAEEAYKNMKNFIKRLKRYIAKHNLPELKYIYVTEFEDDPKKGKIRVHHHIIMNFHDRDVAEQLWEKGGRTHARRLQPDDFGLEGLARYITKDPKDTKRVCTSRNLKKPSVTFSDTKVTRRKAERIARNENDAEIIFEKLYKGYSFNDIKVMYSKYVSGAYIYVRMKKKEQDAKMKARGG